MAQSLSSGQLQVLFTYPFKQPDWKGKLAVATGLWLAGFVVPLIPWVFVAGYWMQLLRLAIDGQDLSLPEWQDWGRLFRDGLKVTAANLVYTVPFLLLFFVGYAGMFGGSVLAALVEESTGSPDPSTGLVALAMTFASFGLFGLAMLGLLVVGFVVPAPLTHLAATGQFGAAFRVGEWWPIFRANLGGYVLAYVLLLGLTMLGSLALQALYMTIVLCCLVPVAMSLLYAYVSVVTGPLFGWAYRDGVQRLQGKVSGSEALAAAGPA